MGLRELPAAARRPGAKVKVWHDARTSLVMAMRGITFDPTAEGWRSAARRLIFDRVPPADVSWREAGEKSLFDSSEPAAASDSPGAADLPAGAADLPAGKADLPAGKADLPAGKADLPAGKADLRVPRAFLALLEAVAPAKDPNRWRLLYSVLWRLTEGDRDLMLRRDDADLLRLRSLAEAGSGAGASPGTAQPFVPRTSDLAELAKAAASCEGCDLYRHATQTVFGRGPASARAVLVGEAPGDQEDLQGAPFVGPAGEVLDRALIQAGLAREQIYVTNAVKHFKFVRTPKRRIHQTPVSSEIEACRPWLAAELAILSPRLLVCLGATASRALLGPGFRLMKQRGQFLDSTLAPRVLATFHPSAVLRAEDEAGRARVYDTLVADLTLAAAAL